MSRVEKTGIYPRGVHIEQLPKFLYLYSQKDPLSPEMLTGLYPEYRLFEVTNNPLVYARLDRISCLPRANQVAIAFVGPSASGKDSIMAETEQLWPGNMAKVRTATNRPIDPSTRGEKAGADYDFCQNNEFETMRAEGMLVESIQQGEYFYGTPVKNVHEAVSTGKPAIVWRGDIFGSSRFKEWFRQTYPQIPFISLFILPNMSFKDYAARVAATRGVKDAYGWRIPKALAEIKEAGKSADVLLLNKPDVTGKPIETSQALIWFLKTLLSQVQ